MVLPILNAPVIYFAIKKAAKLNTAAHNTAWKGDNSVINPGKNEKLNPKDGQMIVPAKACADNANEYCQQLSTCSNFLFQIEYGDQLTCEAAITPGCMDALAAPGTSSGGCGSCTGRGHKFTFGS